MVVPHTGPKGRNRRRRAGFGAAVLAMGVAAAPLVTPVGAAAQYNTFSASVAGVALKQTYGAVSTADDPGTAATQASIAVAPGFNGQTSQMKAVGINADPGTLAGAVLFAAPDCTAFSDGNQGGGYEQCVEAGGGPEYPTAAAQNAGDPSPGQLPPSGYDSGLETASGFPGWAEAFYPQPDQRHVTKCFANKDAANGSSSACDASKDAMYSDAQVDPDKSTARGYAVTENPNDGTLDGSSLSSKSETKLDDSGALVSTVENQGSGFTLPGVPSSQFFVRGFTASAQTVANGDKVSGKASCTIDLAINGQTIDSSQAQQVLAQIPTIGSVTFTYKPPTAPEVKATASQGIEATCTGATLSITYPVPDTGVSVGAGTLTVTYIFGIADAITSAQTNSSPPSGDASGGSSAATLDSGGSGSGSGSGSSPAAATGSLAAAAPSLASPSSPSSGSSAPSASARGMKSKPGAGSVALPARNAGYEKPSNGTLLGLTTGAAVLVIAGVLWLLTGVVRAVSTGSSLRLPGL